MKKRPIFELLCGTAVLFVVALWFKTGANVLPALVFWALLLLCLLANRVKLRFAGWLQWLLVTDILINITISWRCGNLSTLQFGVLTALFVVCVVWLHVSRLTEEDNDKEEREAFDQARAADLPASHGEEMTEHDGLIHPTHCFCQIPDAELRPWVVKRYQEKRSTVEAHQLD